MFGIEIEQTRVYQDAMHEGRRKGAKSLILRLLNRRVGNVSSEVEVRVKALTLTQLEDLGEALLDFGQMSDLMSWLDADRSDRVS
ncbi:DUF4351 domain-containing protein [Chamaesiphon sp. VAR_69_metabat_338]|uniref:DUF4351 domain-containing protein n=1 Tax=Chamaesiphon sp. VAR_69_metabat_338 TaxID=2964704 RepID=UPI00286E5A9F|nr:DUF4351 domain-containing protein [Chamaesiphon sp. VAR_69_metabat_338]